MSCNLPLITPPESISTASTAKLSSSPLNPGFVNVEVDKLGLRADQIAAIVSGDGVTDRSAKLFSICMALLQRGHSENIILSLLTDPNHYLGQVAYEHANTSSRIRAAKWVEKYTLQKAREQVEAGRDLKVEEIKSEKPPLKIVAFNELEPALESPLTLVQGLLGFSNLCILYGPPGGGKTFFALRLAIAIATGDFFFGRKTIKTAVLYGAFENPRSIELRLFAEKKKRSLGNIPLGIFPDPISVIEAERQIVEAIKAFSQTTGQSVGLFVIDTLARSAQVGFDENSAKDMGALIKVFDRIRASTGVCILVIHHSGKDSNKGARGSNALLGAADTEISCANLKAEVTKQRDAERGEQFFFDLVPMPVGKNSQGEEISIPVVRELEGVFESRPLKGRNKIALEALQKLTPSGTEVPKARWQEEFIRTNHSKNGPSRTSLERGFRRAADFLRKNAYTEENDNFVTLLDSGQHGQFADKKKLSAVKGEDKTDNTL